MSDIQAGGVRGCEDVLVMAHRRIARRYTSPRAIRVAIQVAILRHPPFHAPLAGTSATDRQIYPVAPVKTKGTHENPEYQANDSLGREHHLWLMASPKIVGFRVPEAANTERASGKRYGKKHMLK